MPEFGYNELKKQVQDVSDLLSEMCQVFDNLKMTLPIDVQAWWGQYQLDVKDRVARAAREKEAFIKMKESEIRNIQKELEILYSQK